MIYKGKCVGGPEHGREYRTKYPFLQVYIPNGTSTLREKYLDHIDLGIFKPDDSSHLKARRIDVKVFNYEYMQITPEIGIFVEQGIGNPIEIIELLLEHIEPKQEPFLEEYEELANK